MNKIIIIGNSVAGIAAAETIRKQDSESKITVISDEEAKVCYSRRKLPQALQEPEDNFAPLALVDENFYTENKIDLIVNNRVTKIDFEKKKVALAGKERYSYDKLLFASGKSFFVPKDLKGNRKANIFFLNGFSSLSEIRERLALGGHVGIWGSDHLAVFLALLAKSKNADVKIVSSKESLLSAHLNSACSQAIKKFLEEKGIGVVLGRSVTEFLGNGAVNSLRIDSGKVFAAETVIVTENIQPNIDFLKDSPLEVEQGIVVNKCLNTNVDDCFAAGDVAQLKHIEKEPDAFGWGENFARKMGEIAGENILGKESRIEIAPEPVEFDLMDLNICFAGSIGLERAQEQLSYTSADNSFCCFNFKDNKLCGFAAINNKDKNSRFIEWFKQGTSKSEIISFIGEEDSVAQEVAAKNIDQTEVQQDAAQELSAVVAQNQQQGPVPEEPPQNSPSSHQVADETQADEGKPDSPFPKHQ